jgi:hypothetical protein
MLVMERNHAEHYTEAFLVRQSRQLAKALEKQITQCDAAIATLIAQGTELAHKAERLKAIPGVGPVVAAVMPGWSSLTMNWPPQRPRWTRLWKMHFGLTEGEADAEQGTLAGGADAQRDQDGAIPELTIVADLFGAGVKHEIGISAEHPVAPFLEFGVEEFGAVADLGGADAGTAEFLDDGGDLAGGNALDIHFGHGELEGLLGANAFFQGAGIESGVAADLRDANGDGTDPAGEVFGLVAVGVTQAGVGAFARLGLKDLMAFDAHGFIDEQAQAFGEAVVALFSQQLQDVVHQFRIGVVGQVRFMVGWVWLHPNKKPA